MTERKVDPTPKLFDSPEQLAVINAMRGGRLPVCEPDEAHSDDRDERTRVAEELCPICPIRIECRAAGTWERWGVWGGVDRTGAPAKPRRRGEPR